MMNNVKIITAALLMAVTGGGDVAAQRLVRHSAKLSAATVAKMDAVKAAGKKDAARRMMAAYVRLGNEADTARLARRYGVRFNVNAGGVFTALIPCDAVEALTADAGVKYIDTGAEMRPMTDRVRTLTAADMVNAGTGLPAAYTGKGVIVGVIDYGFDFTHPDFNDDAGQSRIKCVWNQNVNSGVISDYGYGCVMTSAEEIAAAAHDRTRDTHGTHVLGIAAGRTDGLFGGMAPEADMAVVATNRTEQGIIDGVDFLLKYAEKQGKPISINLSLGTVLGFKDGTGTLSLMLDRLLSGGKGRLLSIAAGNEGGRNSSLCGDKTAASFLQMPSYGRENIFAQGEAGRRYSLTIALRDTVSGVTLLEQKLTSDKEETLTLTAFGSEPGNGSSSLTASSAVNAVTGAPCFSLNVLYTKKKSEAWTVSMECDGGRYLLACDYGTLTSEGKAGYVDGSSDYSIAATATGREPVSVGAYVSRNSYTDLKGNAYDLTWSEGDVYPLSGCGPAFDGRVKPEVAAPGAAVISSLNSYAAPYSLPETRKTTSFEHNGRTYYRGIDSGTSMASPAVAGILALWLQAVPSLTLADVKEVLRHTSAVTSVPSAEGYGRIDAAAGLKYLLDRSGIGRVESGRVEYDRRTATLTMPVTGQVTICSAAGNIVYSGRSRQVSLSGLPSGVYIVRANGMCMKVMR